MKINDFRNYTRDGIIGGLRCIERFHRAIKQVCNIERFQVRNENPIKNHIFCAIKAFVNLEFMRFDKKISQYFNPSIRACRMSKIIKNDARFFYNSSRFTIDPEKSTTWHNHHDTELFFILSGDGKIKIDDEEVHIKSGDIIELLPLKRHIIYNENKNTILEICNFWWNDEHNFRVSIKEKFLTGNITSDTEINFILPSFTTPNGNLHVGHIAGPLLAADMLNRAYYIQKKESYFISGTIGYQTQVQVKADKLNKTFFETSLFFSKNIQDSLQLIDIEADCFITLKNKDDFFEMVDLFINRLFEKLLLEKKEDEVYYCDQCEKYLFEANIIGNCPHCDHTVNAECEHCYEYFNEKSLKTPTCLTCKKKPKLKKLERYFISLNHFRGIIEDLYHKNSYEGLSRFFVERILSAELPDIPITILAEQGVPFKNENFIGHVIYSAIELVPRFLVSLKILMKDKPNADDWESVLMSKNTNLDLLFGVDNLYLRCIIFPILLSAFNNKLINSIKFIANDFYNLEGYKFSTSRNNVVSVEELKILYDLDYIRYIYINDVMDPG